MEITKKIVKKYNGRIRAAAGPYIDGKMWSEMELCRVEGKESKPGQGFLSSCHIAASKLCVRADGIIVPCLLLSHIELGRINRDNLMDIWRNQPQLQRLRERQDIPLSSFTFCQGCHYIDYCRGGCPAVAYTILGDCYHPSPASCLRRFLTEGGTLPTEISAQNC